MPPISILASILHRLSVDTGMPFTLTPANNNAGTCLAQTHNLGDGRLVVKDASVFPDTYPYRVTCYRQTYTATMPVTNFTIYLISGLDPDNPNSLVIDSAIENTTDRTYPANCPVRQLFTFGYLDDIEDAINAIPEIQGPQGYQGVQGTQGFQGNAGVQGSQGRQGFQGTSGTNGTNGSQGVQGFQGNPGTNGTQGAQGNQGPQGNQGAQGALATGITGLVLGTGTGYTAATAGTDYPGLATSNTFSATQNIGTGNALALYNTADQTTNYERLRAFWSSNIATIATESGGTGSGRNLVLQASNGAALATMTLSRSVTPFLTMTVGSSTSTGNFYSFTSGTLGASSGNVNLLAVNPTLAVTGTAGYTCLLVNPTDTSTGTGLKNLLDLQVGGTSKARVDSTGQVVGTAQSVYNTTDQTTNYERVRTFFSGNVATISTELGGTGTGRNLALTAINSTGGSTTMTLSRSAAPFFNVSSGSGGTNGNQYVFTTSTQSQSSGNATILAVTPSFAQTSTAGWTCLLVNPTDTGSSTGTKLLADFQIGSSSKAKIDLNGQVSAAGYSANVASKTGAYTLTTSDAIVLANATSAAFTVTLPSTASVPTGRRFAIKKVDSSANAVSVNTTSSQTIDGGTTYSLSTQWQSLSVVSDGTNWVII